MRTGYGCSTRHSNTSPSAPKPRCETGNHNPTALGRSATPHTINRMNAELMQALSDLIRRMENLIRPGTVDAADYAAARVRVRSGDLLTDWIPWFTQRAGNDRDWWAPEEGEQVVLLCPSGDPAQGFALPAGFQQAHPAPANSADVHRREYADGSFVEYDRAAHRLIVTVNGGDVQLNATGNVDAAIGGNLEAIADGHAKVTANNIELDGAGGGGVKGVVQGDCLCSFTGAPHPQISATVKGSK